MNEGSKLINTVHTNFQATEHEIEEEERNYLVMERRSVLPSNRKDGENWGVFWKTYIKGYIPPIVSWLPKYTPKYLISDLLAGITVGVMVIPQGLSFALIANVEPVIGLYTAMITSFMYFLLGSSKYLIVGPTAVLSLLVGGFTKQGGSPETFFSDALLLSFLSGLILIVLSFLRLGFLTNLLSKPISVGFTAGAAILISLSQIKNIFGIPMETPETIIVLFKEIVHLAKLHTKVNGWSVLMFSLSFAYIMIVKQIKYTKMVPAPLFSLIMGTLAAYGFDLPNRVGLAVVGEVPKGMPNFTVPIASFDSLLRALPFSFVVAFLCFVEAFTIAKPLAIKEGNDLSADQELFALGISNMVGSFLSSFPAAGSFTRSAVNFSVGAKSQLSGLISAIIVLFSILFLTPLLRFLPFCILASIVMSGVINLFEIHDMIYIWKTKKRDFFILVASFCLTLILGVDTGVLASIGIHVLLLVVATIKMRVEELTYAGDGVFAHILDNPDSPPIPGIILAKVTDSLVYLNIESFMKQVELLLKGHGSLMPRSHRTKIQRRKKLIPPSTNGRVSPVTKNQLSDALGNVADQDSGMQPPSDEAITSLDLEAGNQYLDPSRAKLLEKQQHDAASQEQNPSEDPQNVAHLQTETAHSIASPQPQDASSHGPTSRRRNRHGGREEGLLRDATSSTSSISSLASVSSSSMESDYKQDSIDPSYIDAAEEDAVNGVEEEGEEEETDPTQKYPNAVIFDFSMVNAVDSSSMMRLEELRKILAAEGYSMHFAHVHNAVLEVMYRGDFLNHLGNDGLFLSLTEAMRFLTVAKEKTGFVEMSIPNG